MFNIKLDGKKVYLLSFVFLFIFLFPQLLISLKFSPQQYDGYGQLPNVEYGIIFGALVYDDETLSDVVKERVEAAIEAYKRGKVKKLFFSGDNRHNREVESMISYAENRGVPLSDIVQDNLGIDTNDSCRHFQKYSQEKTLLITQGFHLSRAMYMCESNGIEVEGLKVNKLNILNSRGDNFLQIWTTRMVRFFRETYLTWSFILGLYDKYSNEAEKIEMFDDRF